MAYASTYGWIYLFYHESFQKPYNHAENSLKKKKKKKMKQLE